MKRLALIVAMTLAIAACGDDGVASNGSGESGETTAQGRPVAQTVSSPSEDVPSALDDAFHDTFAAPLINPDEIISGGPPPDGIPSIDEPKFLSTDEVDFLQDNEPVLALDIDGDSRAYPVQILIWHEIVNDTVGDVPVSVTYCPLCNSAIAYDRRLDDRVLEFGTSGRLYNSAMIMYDRQTESMWSHFTGEAVVGFLTGAMLDTHPMSTVSWGEWREANPDGLVLSRETGSSRQYGLNPYPGYDDVESPPFLFDGDADDRFLAKERVIGFEVDEPVAVLASKVVDEGVVDVDDVTVWSLPGTASSLDRGTVEGGRDVGASGVFVNDVEGESLTFSLDGDQFVDEETGSEWNIFGLSISGTHEGTQLEPISHVDTFWFAWAAFQPETEVVN